jgi:type I restriction enzyme R subunit
MSPAISWSSGIWLGSSGSRAQLFGFSGTPIFAENAVGWRTTKDLFAECLHKHVIADAIADENVLRFSVEYWGRLKREMAV